MSRLIDADAVPKKVESVMDMQDLYLPSHFLEWVVDEMPTVEPKHGHWLFYEEPDGYYHTECSECGQWCDEDVFLKDKWHYCPYCGAKMDEVEDE